MGRTRKNGTITYEVSVSPEQYQALESRAQEQETTVEEIVRADLLSDENKERLVPRARKMVRHATIIVSTHPDVGVADRADIPSLEIGLDD